MNKRMIAVLVAILLLSGCQPTDTVGGGNSSQEASPESDPIFQMEEEEPEHDELSEVQDEFPKPKTEQLNSALTLIPGGERLLNSDDRDLFLLKEYGFEMKWMEVNQLEHLDRGTPLTQTETYFLLVPKYTGSRIEVQKLEWDEKNRTTIPVETLYTIASTPDQYGLLLTSNEPETMPNLRVTVTYDSKQYSHTFFYNGRGDRPALLAFPEDENWAHQIDNGTLTINSVQEFGFTNGPGGSDKEALKIGDTFHGWTLLEAKSMDNDLVARFDGTATLKGRLSLEGTDELMGNIVQFIVSEDTQHLLPYFEHDVRIVWFGFENQEEVVAAVGKDSFDFECEITINGYSIDCRPMMTMNSTTFVELLGRVD